MGDRLADTPTVLAAGQALRSDLITNLKTTEPLFINVMILPWGLKLKIGQEVTSYSTWHLQSYVQGFYNSV